MSESSALELDEETREYYADLVWFPVTNPFEDIEEPSLVEEADIDFKKLRPFSLATWKAADIMGLHYLNESAELTLEEQQREMLAYLWLHSAPLEEIAGALWSGAHQVVGHGSEVNENMLRLFTRFRARHILAHRAVIIKILPKKEPENDTTPTGVCGPGGLSFIMGILLSEARLEPERLLWHTWLPQALALYHRALHMKGAWTIHPGKAVKSTDFEDGDATPLEMRGGFDLSQRDDE